MLPTVKKTRHSSRANADFIAGDATVNECLQAPQYKPKHLRVQSQGKTYHRLDMVIEDDAKQRPQRFVGGRR